MNEVVTQVLQLDLNNFESGMTRGAQLWDNLGELARKATNSNPFKKQSDDLAKVNTQLRAGSDLFKKITADPKVLQGEITKLSNQYVKLITQQNRSAKAGKNPETQESIKKTRDLLDTLNKTYDETIAKQKKLNEEGKKSGGGSNKGNLESQGVLGLVGNKFLGGAGSLLGSLGFGIGAAEIIKGIVSVRAEYQALGKQIEISLGSKSAGAAAQRLITEFANKTPLSIAETTAAFNRLIGVGIVPTEKQLFQLSDIAIANRKTINDYVEAIADAQQGEYERLKEFGVRASKAGDQVTFTFRGQTTTIQNTAKAIDEYLLSLGSVAGVAGQTEEAGKLLNGRWSTLKDTFAGIANDIGILLQPAMEKLLDVTQQVASGLSGYIKDLQQVSTKKSGIRAFFQSVFDPRGFNAEAFDAEMEAYEKAEAARKKSGAPVDPLEQKRQQLAAQNAQNEKQRKEAAARLKAEKDAKEAAAKQKQIDLDLLREAQKQVDERKNLLDQIKKVQDDYDKQRLDTLDKSSQEYIDLKKKFDLEEIEQERKKLIELGQVTTGTAYYNRKTQRVERKNNLDYKLPSETEQLFANRRNQVESQSQVDSFEAAEAKSRAEFERNTAAERAEILRKSNELELELRQQLLDTDASLTRKAGESEIDYEKRKNEQLLAIRLKYYEQLLELAEKDPSQKAQILGLKETIAGLRKEVTENTNIAKTGPMDMWDLLGIKFDENAEKNDQLKKYADEALKTTIEVTNSILSQQIAADEQRISSIDAQLQAKQNEVNVELELSRQGLANNLSIKRQEQQQLQNERKKAVEAQRRDQAIQMALNAALQETELALAVAKIFNTTASIPLIGYIAAGVQIAAMLALFASTIGQISNLPKYHDGDEVTIGTARARATSGGRKADEVDARLQIGEGVIRKEAYQANKSTLTKINKLGRRIETSDLAYLLDGTGVELPEAVRERDLLLIQQYNESRAFEPDRDLHKRVDELNSNVRLLIDETRKGNKGSTITQLPDGRIREVDENGNVTVYRRT